VVLVTLVVQGMTLRPLLDRLTLGEDGLVEREVKLARVETLRAALAAASEEPGEELAGLLRRRYELLLRRAEAELAGAPRAAREAVEPGEARAFGAEARLVRATTSAERRRLLALRTDGTIGDAAFQRLEQELDWEELDLQQLAPGGVAGAA
jgi:CPA1 family monovalent cation:H+ antiporter